MLPKIHQDFKEEDADSYKTHITIKKAKRTVDSDSEGNGFLSTIKHEDYIEYFKTEKEVGINGI